MEKTQNLVRNLNEMIVEYAAGEAEVHLEPQTKTTPVAEPEVQGKEQNQLRKETSRKEQSRVELSKIKNQKTTRNSSQMKLTLSGRRI